VAQLVLLPGLDGTGLLFRPLVATLSNVESKVVSYSNDEALSLDCACCKMRLRASRA